MKVGLMYNDIAPLRQILWAENPHGVQQMEATVAAVRSALGAGGYDVKEWALPPAPDLGALAAWDVDLVFNLITGITGKALQIHSVALLEMLDIPFIGSPLEAHTVCLNKWLTKLVLVRSGIPTPPFQRISQSSGFIKSLPFPFPAILKPIREGSSLGITQNSVVHNHRELEQQARALFDQFQQDLLVEALLPGREFTVGLLGNDPLRVLPIQEIIYARWPQHLPKIYSFEAKTYDLPARQCPALIRNPLRKNLERLAIASAKALNTADLLRLDLRLDANGNPMVLEANALPGLQPIYSEYPRMAEAGGISFELLIIELVKAAKQRIGSEGSA